MSCYLRAFGKAFNVDHFVKKHPIPEMEVFRKGEPRIETKLDSDRNSESGFTILVSDADFSKLSAQTEDAVRFLSHEDNMAMLSDVSENPAVEGIDLIFSVELDSPESFPVQSFLFSDALTKIAGKLGLNIELSIYL